jgi:hypothetical protein
MCHAVTNCSNFSSECPFIWEDERTITPLWVSMSHRENVTADNSFRSKCCVVRGWSDHQGTYSILRYRPSVFNAGNQSLKRHTYKVGARDDVDDVVLVCQHRQNNIKIILELKTTFHCHRCTHKGPVLARNNKVTLLITVYSDGNVVFPAKVSLFIVWSLSYNIPGLGFPFFVKKFISRTTKQDLTDDHSSEFRLFRHNRKKAKFRF